MGISYDKAEVHVYLFGAPRIERAGQPVSFDTRKAIALLAYLALGESGSAASYTRDHLAAVLYPEADTHSARGALRRTLSTLRKGIGSACLNTEGERIELKRASIWMDVLAFRESFAQTRQHGHTPDQVCQACLPLLEHCAGLSEKVFFAGFTLRDSPEFDNWQSYQTEVLRQESAAVLEKLSIGLAAQGKFEPAVIVARRRLALDTLHEEAHRALMRLYAWNGQRTAALRQYRECVRILEQELGVPPLEETQRLNRELLENHLPPKPELTILQSAPHHPDQPAAHLAGAQISPVRNDSGYKTGYPLVGRSEQLDELVQAYETSGIRGFLFVVHGEAGIGKSRLASDFLTQVQQRGAASLQARGYEGQAGLAYAPFVDALNVAISSNHSRDRLQAIPPNALALVAQLAPALSELFPGLPPVSSPESPGVQVRFFDALRQVIGTWLAPSKPGRPPGVLFLDDLQWADQASIDLLAYLARRLEGVFILVAWRSGGVPPDHLLHHLMVQSQREGRGASLGLERLRLEDVAEMLHSLPAYDEGSVTDDFLDHLYRETEGNPFFLVEYLDAMLRNALEKDRHSWELPPGVRALLHGHLDSAGELGRQLLSAAAVIGRSFDFLILHLVSGRSEMETIEGLERLLQQGLLIEQPGEKTSLSLAGATIRYDFSHDKLRSLVYEQSSQARRRLLHQRCAEVYAGRARYQPEAAALAAHHYQNAGQQLVAAEWYRHAGDHARQIFANREAITHYQNALAGGHGDTAGLQEAIADLQMLSGNYAGAIESYQAAASVCETHYLPWIEHKLALVYDQLGSWDLAECYFKSALEYLEEAQEYPSPSERAAETSMLYSDWSRAAYRRGEVNAAQELAGQALRLAEAYEDDPALAQAHNNLGILARAAGRFSEAIEHLQGSLEISLSLDDAGRQAAALNNLARVYAESGQINQAIQLSLQALDICQQRGDRHREAALHNNLADLYHLEGQEELAMKHLKESVTILSEMGGEPSGEPQPEIWKLVEW